MPFFQLALSFGPFFLFAANRHTLQVRKPGKSREMRRRRGEKRVWTSASLGRQRRDWGMTAAISAEAAIALPIFMFAIVCLLYPFRMMERQRQVQAALESANEKLCQYAYLEHMLLNGQELPREEGGWKEALLMGAVHGAAGAGAQALAESMFSTEGMENTSSSRSSFFQEEDMSKLRFDYKMRLPFSILGLEGVDFSSASLRRAWIGRDGKVRDQEGAAEEEEQIVYIGKNSPRYHLSRDCHYLSNRLKQVDYDAVSQCRNTSGGKYYACAVCGGAAGPGDVVYIMDSGSRYHADSGCSAITSYVRAVKLSEVEALGPCSYCGAQGNH